MLAQKDVPDHICVVDVVVLCHVAEVRGSRGGWHCQMLPRIHTEWCSITSAAYHVRTSRGMLCGPPPLLRSEILVYTAFYAYGKWYIPPQIGPQLAAIGAAALAVTTAAMLRGLHRANGRSKKFRDRK